MPVRVLGSKAQLNELSAKAAESLRLGNIVREMIAATPGQQPNMRPCLKCGDTAPVGEFKWVKPTNGDPRYQACGDCATGKNTTKGIGTMAHAFAALAN